MNKKGLIGILLKLIFVALLLLLMFYSFNYIKKEYHEEKQYSKFCEERPNFCYCDYVGCEYKISWSSINGLSEDTKDLCKLAKKLEDKKMLFKARCE